MLRWIVGTSLKGRFLVLALAGALVWFGTASLQHAPVDVFPEFAPPRVEVQTTSLGEAVFASTIQASVLGTDVSPDELDDAEIERSIKEINEAIKRSSQHRKG